MDEQCYQCGHEYPARFLKQGLCSECLCEPDEQDLIEAERKMDEQLRTEKRPFNPTLDTEPLPNFGERTIEYEIELLVNFYGKSLTRDEKDQMKTAITTLINKGK